MPASFAQAALRGIRGQCPRCGHANLFRKWLKPVDRCRACGHDWSLASADDIPPYIAILLTGHLLAPVIILFVFEWQLPTWLAGTIVVALAIGLMLAILQPAKGMVIAAQWWLGLMGYTRERPGAE
ncbi:MAG: DUF983 domain-containing protein [Rhodobacteraceae bacterium]|nr:DUF983 domain-containing protein [Paracoccaceae bacterium]